MINKIKTLFEAVKTFLRNFVINTKLKNEFINRKKEGDDFYVFLDLMSFRGTWDIISFLINAKIKSENKNIVIVILPEKEVPVYNNNAPKEKSWMKNISKKIRIDNIIKPSLEIIENTDPKIIYLNDRNDMLQYFNIAKFYFPKNAMPGNIIEWKNNTKEIINHYKENNNIPSVRSPIHYRKLVDEYINVNKIKKKIITITLRDSSFNKTKNSSQKDWGEFSKYLIKKNYHLIIFDDFENISIKAKINSFSDIFFYANIDIRLRLAFYEKSFLNMGVSSGPMALNTYSKYSKFIIFKHLDLNNKSSTSHSSHKKISGLDSKKNEQYPFHDDYKKIIWEPSDNIKVLIREFEKMEKVLD